MCVYRCVDIAGHRSWPPGLSSGYKAGEGLVRDTVTIHALASQRSQMGTSGVKFAAP